MSILQRVALSAAALALTAAAALAETPVLRAQVLKFGTVNWELDVIKHHGLDAANGFDLEVQGVANGAAAKVAFQGGATDVIVSDWLWVARQRAAGKDYVFIPYSKSVGGVMVPEDSQARSLADLAGGRIGIAGGPLDKSWLILQAYAAEQGVDLSDATEQVFGAPPLIFKTALQGDLEGAINYWHFGAKMEAAGMRKLIDVSMAAEALGLDPETPLLGYVVHGETLRTSPELVSGLAAASRSAKEILAENDQEWDRIRERMNAKSDAEFEALKAGFRAGIPSDAPIDEAAAEKMLRFMGHIGGPELVGEATELPPGTFFVPSS
ncbi:MAG: ABC transporter substrate-binding protein [Pseudomonadota bacterium]